MSDFDLSNLGLGGLQWAGLAALFTMLAGGWRNVRACCASVTGLVICRLVVRGYQADGLLMLLRDHFVPLADHHSEIVGWLAHVRPLGRTRLVPMEVSPPTGRFYRRGRLVVWVGRGDYNTSGLEDGANTRDYDGAGLNVLYIRGTLRRDAFALEIAETFNAARADDDGTTRRHLIRHIHGSAGGGGGQIGNRSGRTNGAADLSACRPFRPIGVTHDDLGQGGDTGQSPTERLALSAAGRRLVAEATAWRRDEDWFRDRGLAWRRGWLLYGPPGNGKTALSRAVAEELDLPVYVYDLASLKNREFSDAWGEMLADAPCMALLEDIDAVFDGRTNIAVGGKHGARDVGLTFDCLLNELDGVRRADGLLLVVTTNHPEKLDPALGVPDESGRSSRPGRIDRAIEIGPPDADARAAIVRRVLPDEPDAWYDLVRRGDGDSVAQFQERCAARALAGRENRADPANNADAPTRPRSVLRPSRAGPTVPVTGRG
ncbi:MAG: AAA family ATPase [Planctomycetota bacterium]